MIIKIKTNCNTLLHLTQYQSTIIEHFINYVVDEFTAAQLHLLAILDVYFIIKKILMISLCKNCCKCIIAGWLSQVYLRWKCCLDFWRNVVLIWWMVKLCDKNRKISFFWLSWTKWQHISLVPVLSGPSTTLMNMLTPHEMTGLSLPNIPIFRLLLSHGGK